MLRKKLHEDLKNFIVNVGWTHKIHIVESENLHKWAGIYWWIDIVCSGIATTGILSVLLGKDDFWLKLTTVLVSFIGFVVTVVTKTKDLDKLATKEQEVANKFWELREEATLLLSDVVYQRNTPEKIEIKYMELFKRRREYNKLLSNVSPKVVDLAKKKIKDDKDNNYDDEYQYFISKNLLTLKEEK